MNQSSPSYPAGFSARESKASPNHFPSLTLDSGLLCMLLSSPPDTLLLHRPNQKRILNKNHVYESKNFGDFLLWNYETKLDFLS